MLTLFRPMYMCFVLSPKILVGLCKVTVKSRKRSIWWLKIVPFHKLFNTPLSVVCFIFLFSQNAKIDPQLRNIQQAKKQESERDGEREKKERKRENVLLNRAPCTRLTPNWAGSREREKMLQHIHYHTQKSAKFLKPVKNKEKEIGFFHL